MGMDINATGNAGMKDETKGTGMNGGVLEMQWKQDGLEDGRGIAEEGRAEQTCWRSISDQYLTALDNYLELLALCRNLVVPM